MGQRWGAEQAAEASEGLAWTTVLAIVIGVIASPLLVATHASRASEMDPSYYTNPEISQAP